MKHQIYLYLIKSTFYFLICFLLCFYFLSYTELNSIYQLNSYTLYDEIIFFYFIFLIGLTWLIFSVYLYYLYFKMHTNKTNLYQILIISLYFIVLCFIVYNPLLIFNFNNHLYLIFANIIPIKTNNDNLIVARYYDNLADPDIIFSIKKENKDRAGIYKLTNKLNGNTYIGSSYKLHKRFYAYISPSGLKRTERIIVKAILKYGLINFSLEVLEYIEKDKLSLSFLLEREQYYLDLLKPDYNILKIAGSSKGFKFSDISKKKLSEMRGKGKDHAWFGRKHTDESKLLMSLHNKNSTTIYCYINEGKSTIKNLTFYKEFNSLREASRFFNCPVSSIQYALNKGNLYKKTYYFTKELID